MRTTLNLPDDIYEEARTLAHYNKISMGEAIAKMIRVNSVPPAGIKLTASGVPYFDMPTGLPPLTLEQSLAAKYAMEDEG